MSVAIYSGIWLGWWALLAVIMGILWRRQCRTADATIVDLGWTLGTGAGAVLFSALGTAPLARRAMVGALVAVWAIRLAAHIYRDRVRPGTEDRRYARLRAAWGPDANRRFFWFFQAQALLAVLFAVPAAIAAANEGPLSVWDAVGAAVFLASLVGESAADRQLRRFRSEPANRGRTCRDGLWKYSRHPNYFFEWLHWWAYVCFAWGAPRAWLTLLAPAVMLLFLYKVTGIPATEAQALATRGDDYRRYQATTSPFFPWFPRKDPR